MLKGIRKDLDPRERMEIVHHAVSQGIWEDHPLFGCKPKSFKWIRAFQAHEVVVASKPAAHPSIQPNMPTR